MEIKLRANIVMSKELTIEANDWAETVERAQAMMAEPISYKELTMTKMYYDNIRMDGQEFVAGGVESLKPKEKNALQL